MVLACIVLVWYCGVSLILLGYGVSDNSFGGFWSFTLALIIPICGAFLTLCGVW